MIIYVYYRLITIKYNNVKIVSTNLKLTVNRNLNSLVEITTAQKKKKKLPHLSITLIFTDSFPARGVKIENESVF